MLPIGFGHKTGDFTRHIGPIGQPMKIRFPWFEFAFKYLRLCSVIEDKSLVGVLVDEACRFYQLVFMDQEVVCEAMACEMSDAAIKRWLVEISVGLSLNDLT